MMDNPPPRSGQADLGRDPGDLARRIDGIEERLKELKEQPKPKDGWDKFSTVTAFLSSVLLAGLATTFTIIYQSDEADRRGRAELSQSRQQDHQNRVRELEAVAKFVPYLTGREASEDSKKLAVIALREFASTGVATKFAEAFPSDGTIRALTEIRSTASTTEQKVIDAALARIRAAPAASNALPFKGELHRADIGTWNLRWFTKQGFAASGSRGVSWERRVETVAGAIVGLDPDILAVTEVDSSALNDLVQVLETKGYPASFVTRRATGQPEVGIVYNKNKVTVSDLSADFDRKFKSELEATTSGGLAAFVRKPLFARVSIKERCEVVSLMLMVVHLKAGFPRPDIVEQRLLAARSLAEIVKRIRRETNESIVLLGDFNDPLDSPQLQPLTGSSDLIHVSETEGGTPVSWIGMRDQGTVALDHIMVSRDLANRIRSDQFRWKDAPAVRLDQEIQSYRELVSDHVPVMIPLSYLQECR